MVRAQRRKHHIIYKTTCLVTGKWYIGMHSTDNLEDGYLGSGTILSRSVKKHGKENHVYEIIEHHPDRETLAQREEVILTDEVRNDPLCMNIVRGGLGNVPGYNATETSRQKNSIASKAMWAKRKAEGYVAPKQSVEAVAKRAAANTGKKRTAEQVENLNKGQQKYYESADVETLQERGQKAAATRKERGTNLGGRPKGSHMSEEQKQDQSRKMKGKSIGAQVSCIFCKKTTMTSSFRFHSTC